MSNYYYNEKKGRYEPIKNAPFGVAPKPKRDRNVFTAQTYKDERGKQFSDHYRHANQKRGGQSTPGFGSFDMEELMKKFESYADGSGNTQKTSSPQPRTSSTTTKSQPKKKIGFTWIWIVGFAIFGIIRACAE